MRTSGFRASKSRLTPRKSQLRAGRSRLTAGRSELTAVAAVAVVALASGLLVWTFLGDSERPSPAPAQEPAPARPPTEARPAAQVPDEVSGAQEEGASGEKDVAGGAELTREASGAVDESKDLDSELPDIEIPDLRERLAEQRRQLLLSDRSKLEEKLSVGGLAVQEKIRLFEEFVGKYGVGETAEEVRMLAMLYYYTGRLDDARRILRKLLDRLLVRNTADRSVIRNPVPYQTYALLFATLEKRAGDPSIAESILTDVIERPFPAKYKQWVPQLTLKWFSEDFEVNRHIRAPLSLAEIYIDRGRFDEAQELLDRAVSHALSLPEDHIRSREVPWQVGNAYRSRVRLLLNRASEEGIEDAMKEGLALADEYAAKIRERLNKNNDQAESAPPYHVDGIRREAICCACRRKIDLLFDGADAENIDGTLAAARSIIEEHERLTNRLEWRGDNAESMARSRFRKIETAAEELAEEKRAAE